MNKIKGLKAALGSAVAAAVLVAGAGQAAATQLRFAVGFSSGSDAVIAAESYKEHVEALSDGQLRVRVFPMSLLSFAETSAGVRDGLADIGYLLTPYFPAEYPHTNMLAEASMVSVLEGIGNDRVSFAYTGAMLEYIAKHCDECHQEFAAQNQVFTSTAGSPPYALQCTRPIVSAADMQGLRVRVGGAQWARWAEALGASPVTMPASDALEALGQGVVDCVAISTPDLTNLGLVDEVSHITVDIPGGLFAGTAVGNTNLNTWRRLTTEQRSVLLRAAAHLSAEAAYNYSDRQESVLDEVRKRGGEVLSAVSSLKEATHEFIRNDVETIQRYYTERHNAARAGEILDGFRQLLEKWDGLTQSVNSVDELAQLYWDEVLSDLDPATYGMN